MVRWYEMMKKEMVLYWITAPVHRNP